MSKVKKLLYIWRHDSQFKDIQYNDTLREVLTCDNQPSDTQHNNALPLCSVSLMCASLFIYDYAECHYAEYGYAECLYAGCLGV